MALNIATIRSIVLDILGITLGVLSLYSKFWPTSDSTEKASEPTKNPYDETDLHVTISSDNSTRNVTALLPTKEGNWQVVRISYNLNNSDWPGNRSDLLGEPVPETHHDDL
jgi:hypothetical protein